MTSARKAPIPTYFVDSSPIIGPFMHVRREGCELAPRIHFLGRSGLADISGLKVAFLSGQDINAHTANDLKIKDADSIYTDNCFCQNDVDDVTKKAKDVGIDLLLASAWPYDVHRFTKQLRLIMFCLERRCRHRRCTSACRRS
ncbi:MAG: hypothetical protein P4M11_01185 [Candidatus Pacebacteria bacterium]|nr:hypothetical protein [Candidatus Paceibacterota bacterium]